MSENRQIQENPSNQAAIVLLSGGLDSATVMAIAHSQGFTPYALSFAYGQRQAIELSAAKRVVEAFGAQEHKIVELDLRAFGGSALTANLDVPKDRPIEGMSDHIPITYVPARNTIFLSYALAWAEVLGCFDIFIGVNAVDYSGYPDCRGEFIQAFQQMANLATAATTQGKGSFKLHTPLLNLTKADIIQTGSKLGVDYGITHSCYDPIDDLACGRCDSCALRKDGFAKAGLKDPTRYVNYV